MYLTCIVLTTWNVVIDWSLNALFPERSYQTFSLLVASASCFTCSWRSVHRAHGKHVRSHVWLPKPLHAFSLSWHNDTSALKFVGGISCVSLSVRLHFKASVSLSVRLHFKASVSLLVRLHVKASVRVGYVYGCETWCQPSRSTIYNFYFLFWMCRFHASVWKLSSPKICIRP